MHTMEVLRLPFNTHSMGAAGQSKLLPLLWRKAQFLWPNAVVLVSSDEDGLMQGLWLLSDAAAGESICGNPFVVLAEVDQGPIYLRPPGTAFSLPMMVIWQLM